MNMSKSVKPTTVKQYLDAVPPDRKNLIEFLHQFLQKTAPGLKPFFAYNMLGYGKFKYKNYKNEIISWPIIALANQKNYVSIYVCAIKDGEYIAERRRKELGKVNVGKSCIRFTKLENVNLDSLEEVIKYAAANPGLVGPGKHK